MLAIVMGSRILSVLVIISMIGLRGSAAYLRVVGGKDADPDEFPYVGRMEVRYQLPTPSTATICTSAALSTKWALTAAYCVKTVNRLTSRFNAKFTKPIAIITYKTEYDDPSKMDRLTEVISTHIFPGYRTNFGIHAGVEQQVSRNDIALVRNRPIELTQYGKLSAVDSTTLTGQSATVVGFGRVEEYGVPQSSRLEQKPLQVANVVIKPCDKDYPVSPNLCLTSRCGESITLCTGDTGGPVVHVSGIVGVNAQGALDCVPAQVKRGGSVGLAFITPVSPYIDWIRDVIAKDGEQDNY